MNELSASDRAFLARSVCEFFDWDMAKVDAWWKTPNPMLGGVSPVVMTMMGREQKLYEFVTTAIEEGQPPPSAPTSAA